MRKLRDIVLACVLLPFLLLAIIPSVLKDIWLAWQTRNLPHRTQEYLDYHKRHVEEGKVK